MLCHPERGSGATESKDPPTSPESAEQNSLRLRGIPRLACGFALGYAVTSRSLGMTERCEARAARREGGGIDILIPPMNYRNELFSRVFHLTRGMRR